MQLGITARAPPAQSRRGSPGGKRTDPTVSLLQEGRWFRTSNFYRAGLFWLIASESRERIIADRS